MNIKKMDDKPMIIHTKEKPGLHVKKTPERKIKGRNVPAVRHSPETVQIVKIKSAAGDRKIRLKKSAVYVTDKRKTLQTMTTTGKLEYRDENNSGQNKKENGTVQKRDTNVQNRQGTERKIYESASGGNGIYVPYRKIRTEEAAIKKKSAVSSAVSSAMAKTALDNMDGGDEVYEAYRIADSLAKPVAGSVSAGRNLYCTKVVKERQLKIRKKQLGSHNREKEAKKSAVNTTEKAAQTVKKEIDKETGQKMKISKHKTKTTTETGINGITGRNGTDKRDVKNSTGNRMIELFVTKLRQEENQDNIGKALKDIAGMRFFMMAKHIVRYMGVFLAGLFVVVALIAFPMIAVIAVIYNSPFAVFFPSISSGETTQEVLSSYVSEFNSEVNGELADYAGYGTSEKIYVGFEGSGTPDNFYDILMVYMVKHGNGDTATDMTDKAKQNLKAVFDDMCSYTVSSRTDTETDEEGNTTTTRVKEVNVELKSCYDMVSIYGFNAKEQAVQEEQERASKQKKTNKKEFMKCSGEELPFR